MCRCLDDEVVEVREMAATCVPISLRPEAVCRFDAPIPYRTLSGILRLSPRRSVIALKVRSALFLHALFLRSPLSPSLFLRLRTPENTATDLTLILLCARADVRRTASCA